MVIKEIKLMTLSVGQMDASVLRQLAHKGQLKTDRLPSHTGHGKPNKKDGLRGSSLHETLQGISKNTELFSAIGQTSSLDKGNINKPRVMAQSPKCSI